MSNKLNSKKPIFVQDSPDYKTIRRNIIGGVIITFIMFVIFSAILVEGWGVM